MAGDAGRALGGAGFGGARLRGGWGGVFTGRFGGEGRGARTANVRATVAAAVNQALITYEAPVRGRKPRNCTLAAVSIYPQVRFMLSVAQPSQFPPDTGWELAMAGRSNAGKSSAINALLGRNNLARTSKTPGRTQLLNYFELTHGRRLVDLPGYEHADAPSAVRATWAPLIQGLRERESFRALMLVVDSRRSLKPEDFGLLDWADLPAIAGARAAREGRPADAVRAHGHVEAGESGARRSRERADLLRAQGAGAGGGAPRGVNVGSAGRRAGRTIKRPRWVNHRGRQTRDRSRCTGQPAQGGKRGVLAYSIGQTRGVENSSCSPQKTFVKNQGVAAVL